jgi:hypothetical protein
MPWPGNFENILGCVDISILNVATGRTDMRTDREGLLHNLSTSIALLTGEPGVHSYDSMSSILSFDSEDIEELSPTSIRNGFGKVMVLYQIRNLEVFYSNMVIVVSVLLCHLKMMVTALALDLQMGLCCAPSSFAFTVTALLASARGALFASERLLRGMIEPWVLYRMPFAIGKERFESDINADVSMFTGVRIMLGLWLRFTNNQGVPMPIGSQHKMSSLRSPEGGTMHLDLQGTAQLLRDGKMLAVRGKLKVSLILPQLDGMPTVRLLEAGEAYTRDVVLLGSQKPFEGFRQTIREHLYRTGRDMFPATSFESHVHLILGGKCAFFLILLLHRQEHLIIEFARLDQASHEQLSLRFIRIETVFKCSHTLCFTRCLVNCQEAEVSPLPKPQRRNGPYILLTEVRGFTGRIDKKGSLEGDK